MNKKTILFSLFFFLLSLSCALTEANGEANTLLVEEGFSLSIPQEFEKIPKEVSENDLSKIVTYRFKSPSSSEFLEVTISQMTTFISNQGNQLERVNAFQSEEITRKFSILFKQSQKFDISPLEKVEWKNSKIIEDSQQIILFLENEIIVPRSGKQTRQNKYYIFSHPTGVYTLHFSIKESNEKINKEIATIVESFKPAPIPDLDSNEKWLPIRTMKDIDFSLPENYQKGRIEIAEDSNYKGEFQGFSAKDVPVSYPYLITINRIYPKDALGENATTFKMTDALKSPAISVTLNKYFQKSFIDSLPGDVPHFWEDSEVEMIDDKYVLVMKGYFQISTDEFPIYHEHYIWTHPTGVYRLTFHFINQKDSRSEDFINKTLESFTIKSTQK